VRKLTASIFEKFIKRGNYLKKVTAEDP